MEAMQLYYGGPIGRAMRMFLCDDLYATISNFYATVANVDMTVSVVGKSRSCCFNGEFHTDS